MNDATDRDAILGRVRQALRTPSPLPHWARDATPAGSLFPSPGATRQELIERFAVEFAAVQGEWINVQPEHAPSDWFQEWVANNGWKSVLACDDRIVRSVVQPPPNAICRVQWCNPSSTSREGWEAFDVGVTSCEALIAESGSVLVSSGSSGRAPSVLPPVHLAIATPDQIVPDIEAAFARLRSRYGDRLPSSVSLITGPSRTGDIEKILVLGAHGPKRLAVCVLPGAV